MVGDGNENTHIDTHTHTLIGPRFIDFRMKEKPINKFAFGVSLEFLGRVCVCVNRMVGVAGSRTYKFLHIFNEFQSFA